MCWALPGAPQRPGDGPGGPSPPAALGQLCVVGGLGVGTESWPPTRWAGVRSGEQGQGPCGCLPGFCPVPSLFRPCSVLGLVQCQPRREQGEFHSSWVFRVLGALSGGRVGWEDT